MGLFNIVYSNLPGSLLPVRLRKSKHIAWLRALVNGAVVPLYNTFFANRSANVYYLKHNSQVCYMEAALNDTFDELPRRIYIKDPVYVLPVFIYITSEAIVRPLALTSEITTTFSAYDAPIYLYTEAEISAAVSDFVVWVPTSLGILTDVNRRNQLSALVNRYRLPSKSNWALIAFP